MMELEELLQDAAKHWPYYSVGAAVILNYLIEPLYYICDEHSKTKYSQVVNEGLIRCGLNPDKNGFYNMYVLLKHQLTHFPTFRVLSDYFNNTNSISQSSSSPQN